MRFPTYLWRTQCSPKFSFLVDVQLYYDHYQLNIMAIHIFRIIILAKLLRMRSQYIVIQSSIQQLIWTLCFSASICGQFTLKSTLNTGSILFFPALCIGNGENLQMSVCGISRTTYFAFYLWRKTEIRKSIVCLSHTFDFGKCAR